MQVNINEPPSYPPLFRISARKTAQADKRDRPLLVLRTGHTALHPALEASLLTRKSTPCATMALNPGQRMYHSPPSTSCRLMPCHSQHTIAPVCQKLGAMPTESDIPDSLWCDLKQPGHERSSGSKTDTTQASIQHASWHCSSLKISNPELGCKHVSSPKPGLRVRPLSCISPVGSTAACSRNNKLTSLSESLSQVVDVLRPCK